MSNRMLFWVLVIVGIIIILGSVFAHQLGIGSAGFGTKKIIGVIVGVIVALGGVWGIVSANR